MWGEPVMSDGVVRIGDKAINIGDQLLEIIKGEQQDKELIVILNKDTGGVSSVFVKGNEFDEEKIKNQIVEDLNATAIEKEKGLYSLEVKPVESGSNGIG